MRHAYFIACMCAIICDHSHENEPYLCLSLNRLLRKNDFKFVVSKSSENINHRPN